MSSTALRVVSWNLNQRLEAGSQGDFLRGLDPQPDLLLLQEVNPKSIGLLADRAEMTWRRLSIDYYQKPMTDTRIKICGVAMLGRDEEPHDVRILSDIDFPEKILTALVTIRGCQFVAASYHAPPGSNPKVRDKKPAQAVTFARKLADIQDPVLFGADLNTPKVDSANFGEVEMWWPDEHTLAGPRKIHDLEDVLRQWLRCHPTDQERLSQDCPNGPLRVSYQRQTWGVIRQSRYDAIWVSRHFRAVKVDYPFNESRNLSDHSPVIADLIFT